MTPITARGHRRTRHQAAPDRTPPTLTAARKRKPTPRATKVTSNPLTLYVLRDSAHCHNFGSTGTQLWDRIALWAGQQT